jgi:D-alanyl-D-alanine carboxypeptidase
LPSTDWGLEDDKFFNTMLPDSTGTCPAGTVPVYRLYNAGMGGGPNHRFVTSQTERQTMHNNEFVAEGNGICVDM